MKTKEPEMIKYEIDYSFEEELNSQPAVEKRIKFLGEVEKDTYQVTETSSKQ